MEAALPGPVTLSCQGLPMLVLAVDGHPARPRSARALTLWPGERADVVLSADQPPALGGKPEFRLDVQPADDRPGRPAAAAVVLPFKEREGKRKDKVHNRPTAAAPQPRCASGVSNLLPAERSAGRRVATPPCDKVRPPLRF